MSRQRPNPHDFTIHADHTATPAGSPVHSNQNNQFALRPIPDNGQQRTRMPRPADPTTRAALFADPRALAAAQQTQYPPTGQPVQVTQHPHGYEVNVAWHYGYLDQVYQRQRQRTKPDVNPMWSSGVFRASDASYRANNVAVPGTIWPTPATGMVSNLQQFRTIERSGIYYWSVLPNGYVQFTWHAQTAERSRDPLILMQTDPAD
ncbi:hypothetical protein S40293_11303 [Stachybotrys chartarum IBT 40293]|nr:hypothetical protein S40293_11303 [Stachybotrys chartarum IBT 40293]